MNLTTGEVKRIEGYGVKVISTNCQPSAAKDKSLPTDSYILKLEKDGEVWYDIVKGLRSNIFDAYYDTFGHCMKRMDWTDGTINPKMWGYQAKSEKKKK